jgi:hypothetical protein
LIPITLFHFTLRVSRNQDPIIFHVSR